MLVLPGSTTQTRTRYRAEMASIVRRGNSWRVSWRLGGTRTGEQQGCSWHTEAVAVQAKHIAEAHNHTWTDEQVIEAIVGPLDNDPTQEPAIPSSPTVANFADTWLGAKTAISPSTRQRYRRQLDTVILPTELDTRRGTPTLGSLPIDDVSGTDISAFLKTIQDGYEPTTVTRYYSVVYALFAYALGEGLIRSNPARRTDFIRGLIAHDDASDDGENHVYLQMWEFERILAKASDDAKPVIEFLGGTGCRWSEATAVPVKAFHADGAKSKVRVYRAWKYDGNGGWYLGPTKGRTRRTLTVGRSVADAVTSAMDRTGPDELLLRAPDGGRLDYSNFRDRRWMPAVRAAMRCDEHPPLPRGRQVADPAVAVAVRCGEFGGRNSKGGPCRRWVMRGWDRCHDCARPDPKAVSTCACPGVLRRSPTIHDLRHSHAAWLVADGRTVLVISRRLGHRSTAVTELIYAGILPEVEEAAGGSFDRMRGRRD